MASRIQKREAEEIAAKLRAELVEGSNHTLATVKYNGVLIVTFGIRRGRKSGHGHIPRQLHINEARAIELARCPLTRDAYFDLLRKQGVIPDL